MWGKIHPSAFSSPWGRWVWTSTREQASCCSGRTSWTGRCCTSDCVRGSETILPASCPQAPLTVLPGARRSSAVRSFILPPFIYFRLKLLQQKGRQRRCFLISLLLCPPHHHGGATGKVELSWSGWKWCESGPSSGQGQLCFQIGLGVSVNTGLSAGIQCDSARKLSGECYLCLLAIDYFILPLLCTLSRKSAPLGHWYFSSFIIYCLPFFPSSLSLLSFSVSLLLFFFSLFLTVHTFDILQHLGVRLLVDSGRQQSTGVALLLIQFFCFQSWGKK